MNPTEQRSAPREEIFYGVPTDVESEDVDTEDIGFEEQIDRPWDPAQIRVTTKTFSLRQILDMRDEGDLELAPDFQRNRVWKREQKSRLIESILLQIPLPAFYFAEDQEGLLRVVDGLQRLSAIYSFVRGEADDTFGLAGLEYLDYNGWTFDDLPHPWKRRLHNTQIVVHVIDPTTPPGVKYDIFKRINTGGSPLNGQEIRHCMSKQRSRDFLKRCAHTEEFNQATGNALRDHIRMNDREMVLRFSAFRLLGSPAYYSDFRAMDVFLEEATQQLDDPVTVSDESLEILYGEFCQAMINSYTVFGDHAFRKWPRSTESRNPINRPLFEAWSVTLADFDTADIMHRRPAIQGAARTLMTDDIDYISAITSSTGDPNKVRIRFEKTGIAARTQR